MASVLSRARAAFQAGDVPQAEGLLAAFTRERFQLPVLRAEVRRDGYSLNSLNGFLHLQEPWEDAGQLLFFKFHQEEGEEATVGEYYRGQLLKEAGYPIDMPVLHSTEVGAQMLIYRARRCPRLADVCLDLERGKLPWSRAAGVIAAQERLDDLIAQRYLATLHQATSEDMARESIWQLFYWRLVEGEKRAVPGGRWQRFYLEQCQTLEGVAAPVPYADFVARTWRINGIRYRSTVGALFQRAAEVIQPWSQPWDAAVVAHGDAHNANVWLVEEPGGGERLEWFDPAFAGGHIPALLAEIKATFHNIFAHPRWLYQPEEASPLLDIRARLEAKEIVVEHGWSPGPLREAFWTGKTQRVWRPLLAELRHRGWLRNDWREFIRLALFCCPTLVMNLTVGRGPHTPRTSLLGWSLAVQLGSEPDRGEDVVTRWLDGL